MLIALSFSLRERTRSAYYITLILLIIWAGVSILKWLDYEEAITLFIIFLIFLPSKKYFYRKHSLFDTNYIKESSIFMTLILVLSLFIWLFLYKNIQYQPELWWQFAWSWDTSRFLRGIIWGAIIIVFYSILQILKSRHETLSLPDNEDVAKLQDILEESQQASANLVYLKDKYIIQSDDAWAFIMFAIQWKNAIALWDPIWKSKNFTECIWKFRNFCKKNALRSCFYEVSKENISLYLDIGMYAIKIGEEAKVALDDFSLSWKSKQDLRSAQNKFSKLWYYFKYYNKQEVPAIIGTLKDISDEWLSHKNAKEKWFSLWKFDEEYISHFPVATICDESGEIKAFVNIWESAQKYEMSWDIMRYRSDTPNWIMELLFTECIVYAQKQWFKYFNFGMAPLSGVKKWEILSTWNKIAGFIYNYWEHFYNFKWLRKYKEKYSPEWESKYLVTENIMQVPVTLKNVTTLISGGIKWIIKK